MQVLGSGKAPVNGFTSGRCASQNPHPNQTGEGDHKSDKTALSSISTMKEEESLLSSDRSEKLAVAPLASAIYRRP